MVLTQMTRNGYPFMGRGVNSNDSTDTTCCLASLNPLPEQSHPGIVMENDKCIRRKAASLDYSPNLTSEFRRKSPPEEEGFHFPGMGKI